jgi:hypothetical protein
MTTTVLPSETEPRARAECEPFDFWAGEPPEEGFDAPEVTRYEVAAWERNARRNPKNPIASSADWSA